MLKWQVTLFPKIEFSISLLDNKHILQSHTKVSILIITRFWTQYQNISLQKLQNTQHTSIMHNKAKNTRLLNKQTNKHVQNSYLVAEETEQIRPALVRLH